MNNPAFYPKAAFKIKLPAEAPHAAARRGKQGSRLFMSRGYYPLSPAGFLLLPPHSLPLIDASQRVMPVMDSHAQW